MSVRTVPPWRWVVGVGTVAVAAILIVPRLRSDDGEAPPPAEEAPTETLPTLLPLAPGSDRVDIEAPVLSNATVVDNPLFPISDLHSAVLLGNDEGQPIRIETTLMPYTVSLEVNGEEVEALESQFVAYENGRIVEVATDWYTQDGAGNVWYLGEDVFNYDDGVVADTDGTWRVGRNDAPAAMIMPAAPQGGEVFRPENIPGVLMEEVTVSQVDLTMDGPTGQVDGCAVARENHTLEGVYEDKWFCPGYGEFFSGVGDSLEGIAIAVPVDATAGGVPAELVTIHREALTITEAAAAEDWDIVVASHARLLEARDVYAAGHDVPPRLANQMSRALDALAGDGLVPAVVDRNVEGTANAALDVATAALDLQLQFRPETEVDQERLEIWARQLVLDANRQEAVPGFVAGDVTTLEWILPRFAPTLDDAALADIEATLEDLRAAADDEDVATAASLAPQLVEAISSLG